MVDGRAGQHRPQLGTGAATGEKCRERLDRVAPVGPHAAGVGEQAHLVPERDQPLRQPVGRMPGLPPDAFGIEALAQNSKALGRTWRRVRLDHAACSCLTP